MFCRTIVMMLPNLLADTMNTVLRVGSFTYRNSVIFFYPECVAFKLETNKICCRPMAYFI